MPKRSRVPSADLIIAKVRDKPQLWASYHPSYRVQHEKVKLWRQIADEVGYTDEEVKKKWKNLKDQYRKELKKGMDGDFVSGWKHLASMEFLKDELLVQADNTEHSVKDEINTQLFTESESDEEERKPTKKFKAKSSKKEEPAIEEPSRVANRIGTKKMNFVIRKLDSIKETIDSKLVPEQEKRNDPEYQFLMSLLPSIQKLSEIQRIQFRSRVYDCLLEAITQNEFHNPLDTKMFVHTTETD